MRAEHSAKLYIAQKAYSPLVADRATLKRLELAWGSNLLAQGSRRDFKTSFPLPEEADNDYNQVRFCAVLHDGQVCCQRWRAARARDPAFFDPISTTTPLILSRRATFWTGWGRRASLWRLSRRKAWSATGKSGKLRPTFTHEFNHSPLDVCEG